MTPERQKEQLEHDSDMRRKEHLRAVLEKVMAGISRTVTDLVDLLANLEALETAVCLSSGPQREMVSKKHARRRRRPWRRWRRESKP